MRIIRCNFWLILLLFTVVYGSNWQECLRRENMTTPTKIEILRSFFEENEIDSYIVPMSDDHNSEYPSDADRRLEFISDFTGSAGLGLISKDRAWFWTDGRYFLQAENELDAAVWTLMKSGTPNTPNCTDFMVSEKSIQKVGFDPYTWTLASAEDMRKKLEKAGKTLVGLHAGCLVGFKDLSGLAEGEYNLVDKVWQKVGGRPKYPINPILVMSDDVAGESYKDKLSRIHEAMAKENADYLIVSQLADVAWLFNLRGLDSDYSRVFLAYAVITRDKSILFLREHTAQGRLPIETLKYLKEINIEVRDHAEISQYVAEISTKLIEEAGKKAANAEDTPGTAVETPGAAGETAQDEAKIWIDSSVNAALTYLIETKLGGKERCIEKRSPIYLFKGVKNENEIRGMRRAHIADGTALALFFSYLDVKNHRRPLVHASSCTCFHTLCVYMYFQTLCISNAFLLQSLPPYDLEQLTEVTAADKLELYRRSMRDFVALSFPTIASVDSNAAIIHYRAQPETCKKLNASGLFLVDSGAHYIDGTTDTTRTVHLGIPSEKEKDLYTRVLLGHVDIASLIFPANTTGPAMDSMARKYLWEIGLNFMHGTGHGVGHSLEVHEDPPRISVSPHSCVQISAPV